MTHLCSIGREQTGPSWFLSKVDRQKGKEIDKPPTNGLQTVQTFWDGLRLNEHASVLLLLVWSVDSSGWKLEPYKATKLPYILFCSL